MHTSLLVRKRESGAALVVGLLLLVVLTLLAISTMNTASMELIMAGNEQYRSRAFNLAETGIEVGVRLITIPTSRNTPATTVGTGTDTYTYSITPQFGGRGKSNVPGASAGANGYEAYYFRLTSVGQAARGATNTSWQEFYEVAPPSGEIGRDTSICSGKDDLDASLVGC